MFDQSRSPYIRSVANWTTISLSSAAAFVAGGLLGLMVGSGLRLDSIPLWIEALSTGALSAFAYIQIRREQDRTRRDEDRERRQRTMTLETARRLVAQAAILVRDAASLFERWPVATRYQAGQTILSRSDIPFLRAQLAALPVGELDDEHRKAVYDTQIVFDMAAAVIRDAANPTSALTTGAGTTLATYAESLMACVRLISPNGEGLALAGGPFGVHE